jgi:hypothetical protein
MGALPGRRPEIGVARFPALPPRGRGPLDAETNAREKWNRKDVDPRTGGYAKQGES